jgi:NAD(P)-dependent dehydrogenase (short-subunit alcohol dehydrogenase family)
MEPKNILITGSSKGLGASMAKGFAGQGHRIVINYLHSEAAARRLYDEITAQVDLQPVLMIKADMSRRDDVRSLFRQVVAQIGQPDVLINCAGINLDGPFWEMTDEKWERVVDVHLKGAFIACREFAINFKEQNGHIINIGASTGVMGPITLQSKRVSSPSANVWHWN